MRKITAGLFISLDGVIEAPETWHFPYYNKEMGAAVDAQLGAADTLLFGRKTFEAFADAWPERETAEEGDAPFAKKLGDARKIVVTDQKPTLAWRNSELLEGDLVTAVTALKAEPGGDIAMSGSVSVVRQLLEADLLDELHLLVHPVVIGTGMRLFGEADDVLPLALLRSETFENGVLNLVYGPDDSPVEAGYEEAIEAVAKVTADR